MAGQQGLILLMMVRFHPSQHRCGVSIDSDVRLVMSEEVGASPTRHPKELW